jgi:uncharacterized protein (TIGR03435 family)
MDTPAIHAQALQAAVPPADLPAPKFEVASIKQAAHNEPEFPDSLNNQMVYLLAHSAMPARGRFDIRVPLKWLIMLAYDVRDSQVSGGPAWVSSDRYVISAKTDGKAAFDQIRLALQSLLAERFKLTLRHDTRLVPIYELRAAKSGFKIEAAKEGSCDRPENARPAVEPKQSPAGHPQTCGSMWRTAVSGAPDRKDRIEGFAVTMPSLMVLLMQEASDRVIIDKTGFTRKFDFRLEFTPASRSGGLTPTAPGESENSASLPGVSIFTALEQQLGLRLEATKGMADVLVIDHVERPTEN